MNRGLDLIREFEGCRLEAYPDPASGGEPWTIGYGHTNGVKAGDKITQAQAEAYLDADVAECQDAIRECVTVPLTEGQLWALTSFAFNLGAGALRESTLLRFLNAGDYTAAADQFPRWIFAAGKTMPGLISRRAVERSLFLDGLDALPPSQAPQAPPATETAPQPRQEAPVIPLIPILSGLASIVIDLFTPVARQKIAAEMNRHTDNPEIGQQIADGVINAVKAATGKQDPLEAVVAAKSDPAVLAKVETDVMADLAKMAPILSKIAELDKVSWDAEEASRNAAAARANTQDPFLTRSIVAMVASMMLIIAGLIGLLAWLKVDATIVAGLAGLFTTLAGGVTAKFNTRYDYAYGSSRSSGAKDVLINELSKRPQP